MQSRRSFVTSTLGAVAVLAAQGPRKAAAQANRRLIVDAQVHLWKAESPDWKWVPGLQPQLPEPFTIERLVPMMDEAGVDRAVIVPPSWPGDRNDYALEAVKRYPTRFRVMGRIPLQDPKSADLLPKWKEQEGMLGVRVTFNTAPRTGSGERPKRPDFQSCVSRRAALRCSAPLRSSTRSSR
jgi:predicted TIM-barrel fold metal-dependent hydrolase